MNRMCVMRWFARVRACMCLCVRLFVRVPHVFVFVGLYYAMWHELAWCNWCNECIVTYRYDLIVLLHCANGCMCLGLIVIFLWEKSFSMTFNASAIKTMEGRRWERKCGATKFPPEIIRNPCAWKSPRRAPRNVQRRKTMIHLLEGKFATHKARFQYDSREHVDHNLMPCCVRRAATFSFQAWRTPCHGRDRDQSKVLGGPTKARSNLRKKKRFCDTHKIGEQCDVWKNKQQNVIKDS